METIKRYNNRKLYSTTLSKYVTLKYVIDLVKTHQKFIVIDNVTKEDITESTLKQTVPLLDISSSTLSSLIRSL